MNFEIDAIQTISNLVAIIMVCLVILLNYDIIVTLRRFNNRK
jgi:hypothetical protein